MPEQMRFDFWEEASYQAQFEAFHRRHPQVFAYLTELCFELRKKGWRHYGIKTLWERTRWHFHLEKDPQFGDPFWLNNNFHSRYARLIVQQHPELKQFFEFRELRAP